MPRLDKNLLNSVEKNLDKTTFLWYSEDDRLFLHSDNVLMRLLDIFKGEDVWVAPSLRIRKENESLFEDLRKEMISRKYSLKTVKAYIHYNEDLLKFTNKQSEDITEKHIKDYPKLCVKFAL